MITSLFLWQSDMAVFTRASAISRHCRLSSQLCKQLSFPQISSRRLLQSLRSLSSDTSDKDFEKHKEKCVQEPHHFNWNPQTVKTTEHIDKAQKKNEEAHTMPHPIWTEKEAVDVCITHERPQSATDWAAYIAVMAMRKGFDFFSGYTLKSYIKTLDERDMLRRCIFLETVVGVPGFAAAMIRHLQSLRRMQRDNGWIHTLLEEAENERMHLMTFCSCATRDRSWGPPSRRRKSFSPPCSVWPTWSHPTFVTGKDIWLDKKRCTWMKEFKFFGKKSLNCVQSLESKYHINFNLIIKT